MSRAYGRRLHSEAFDEPEACPECGARLQRRTGVYAEWVETSRSRPPASLWCPECEVWVEPAGRADDDDEPDSRPRRHVDRDGVFRAVCGDEEDEDGK